MFIVGSFECMVILSTAYCLAVAPPLSPPKTRIGPVILGPAKYDSEMDLKVSHISQLKTKHIKIEAISINLTSWASLMLLFPVCLFPHTLDLLFAD